MIFYSQLTQLILSFYREEPAPLQTLQILHTCKLSRWWGTFQIHCVTPESAEAVVKAIGLLREPIAQLRLAQQIKVSVNGHVFATFPVKPEKSKSKTSIHKS
ncbi:MAG TPA: hypothetical protein V6C84_29615 [Coleofasciculaceae cyanobacterium]|jgi:hypothetical protein